MRQSLRLVSGLYLKLSLLTIAVGFLLRIVLLFNEQTTDLGFSFGEWLQVFLLGAVNDLCAATIGFVFLWLFSMSVSETKYGKPWGYIILGILVAALCYVTFCNTIFDEYGSVAPQIASAVLGYWAGTFALRLFFKGFRSYWTTVWFALIITLYVGAILFNGLSEYFFWSEFGVRYNFIAVDYLVYTNEVVGNIMESYPVVPMTLGLILVTLVVTWYLFRRDLALADRLKGWRWKAVAGPAYIAAVLLAVWLLNFNTRFQDSQNVYVNELQANGLYKFYDAFVKNELNYKQFYITEPEEQAEAFRRQITVASPEQTFSSFGALREWISNSLLLFTQSRQAAASQDTAVATVKAYIESHLSDELDRDTLAAMVYLNADYLSHLFKKDTGSSLINYIIDRRIARSKDLLAKGEMSIRDIAITCGFQNISYFSRQFKKSTGMTPRQFKN